jgi:hypothetical protein
VTLVRQLPIASRPADASAFLDAMPYPPTSVGVVDPVAVDRGRVEVKAWKRFGDEEEVRGDLVLLAGAPRYCEDVLREPTEIAVLSRDPGRALLPGHGLRSGDGPIWIASSPTAEPDATRLWVRVVSDDEIELCVSLRAALTGESPGSLPSVAKVGGSAYLVARAPETSRLAWFRVCSLPVEESAPDLGYSWRADHSPETRAYAVVSPGPEGDGRLNSPLAVSFQLLR